MSLTEVQRKYRRDILRGMSRYLWIWAYMNWRNEGRPAGEARRGARQPVPSDEEYEYTWDVAVPAWTEMSSTVIPAIRRRGANLDDESTWEDIAPPTPAAAGKAAKDLEELIARAHDMPVDGAMVQLFEIVMTLDAGEPYQLDPLAPSHPQPVMRGYAGVVRDQLDVAHEFGEALASMALGTGLSWFDKHRSGHGMDDASLVPVTFEIHREGDELVWSGGAEADNPGWKVQSLLFDRRDWAEQRAKDWARNHGYHYGQVDVTERKIRLRQREPVAGAPCRIKSFGKGIQAILCPVENPAGCCDGPMGNPMVMDAAGVRRLIQQHGRRLFYTSSGALSVDEVRRVAKGDPVLARAIARELGARS